MTQSLLSAVLDSWQRNNRIVRNVLNVLPEDGLTYVAMEGSPSVAELFYHIHDVRYFFVSQTAPEFSQNIPEFFKAEVTHDIHRITTMLNQSASAVHDAVKSRLESGQDLAGKNVRYDHPVLLLQHMLWHEGYHVGQMKIALKRSGFVLNDEQEMTGIWNVWRHESVE